jgi:16S rRNA (uracil1498-N3)-methyltransferase
MHRFYLPPQQTREQPLFLTGREAHHGLHVLRLRPGDHVSVLNGIGSEFICEVVESDRDKIRLTTLEQKQHATPQSQITLLQALPKGKLIESIIQKATELGVARIVPLLSERVVSNLDSKDGERKAAKWQLTAIEALKQCGAPWLPKVEEPVSPAAFIHRHEHFDLPLVGALQGEARHPREYFTAFQHRHGAKPKTICFWIGPEGDFTAEEIAAIKTSGALPITLGPLILRTETAAAYCLSLANYELTSASAVAVTAN